MGSSGSMAGISGSNVSKPARAVRSTDVAYLAGLFTASRTWLESLNGPQKSAAPESLDRKKSRPGVTFFWVVKLMAFQPTGSATRVSGAVWVAS